MIASGMDSLIHCDVDVIDLGKISEGAVRPPLPFGYPCLQRLIT